MSVQMDILENKKWKRTHAKYHQALGASFCRFVMEHDAEKKHMAGNKELPTCMECSKLVKFFRLAHAVKTGKISVEEATAMAERMDEEYNALIAVRRLASKKRA